jgi:hypothetical protein
MNGPNKKYFTQNLSLFCFELRCNCFFFYFFFFFFLDESKNFIKLNQLYTLVTTSPKTSSR